MTERLTNEEREALIAGDRAGVARPDEADDLALMADLLADPSTWAEPDASLENAVVRGRRGRRCPDRRLGANDRDAARIGAACRRRRRILLAAVAVAATLAIVLGVFVATEERLERRLTQPAHRDRARRRAPAASAEITHTTAGFRVDARRARPPDAAGR